MTKISSWEPAIPEPVSMEDPQNRGVTSLNHLELYPGLALLTPTKIPPFYLDVGALKLIPDHLFWAMDALALVVLAPHGKFRCANRRR